MRFGSVEFFKVLIKTVLAILFFVPLILAVVFGVLFAQKNTQANKLQEENVIIQQDNERLSAVADFLVGEKAGNAEDVREIMKRSGTSYDEFIALAMEKKDIDAQGMYDILSKSGISDKDIIAMAAAKKTVNADGFYEVMSKNGITSSDLVKAVLNRNGSSAEDFYNILSECGMSDREIIDLINKKNGTSEPSNNGTSETSEPWGETSEPAEESPYAELYPDMYVTAPENYTFEEGTIYLTFDDGPSQYTYGILDYLSRYNIKATWFVVPSHEEWCYNALKAISDAGHTVAVHSASHDYVKIYDSVEAYLEDFHEAWDIVREATGKTPQIFRFPGGSNNDFNVDTREAIIKEMTRRGFRFYDWNVQSNDVAGANWQEMYNSIPRDCHNQTRPIVLFHDTMQSTLYVIEDVLKVLVDEGYKFDAIRNDTRPVQFVGPFS